MEYSLLRSNVMEIKTKITIIVIIGFAFLITSAQSKNMTYEINDDSEAKSKAVKDEEADIIYVQVSGAVENAGLYEMKSGDRVNDLLIQADVKAYNEECINLAQKLVDEENIYIPSKEEQCAEKSAVDENDIVNINSASEYELQVIPGIGESKADAIVDYREVNGSFETKQDLLEVEGISEGLLASIEPYIRLY